MKASSIVIVLTFTCAATLACGRRVHCAATREYNCRYVRVTKCFEEFAWRTTVKCTEQLERVCDEECLDGKNITEKPLPVEECVRPAPEPPAALQQRATEMLYDIEAQKRREERIRNIP
jgi:hypothetical protein